MKIKPQMLLLHPAFLACLALLLLNDFYFKYEFHNGLTGKLSDFAGLFAFSVFLFVLFPSYKKIIGGFVCLFFLWWKSPLSEPAILFLNNQFHLPVCRVIDYSDYAALFVLPLAYYTKPLSYSPGLARSIVSYLVGMIAFFSFTATSMYRSLYYPNRQNEMRINERFRSKMTEDQILQKLESMRIDYYRDSIRFYPAEKYDFYYRIQSEKDTVRWQPIRSNLDSSIYVRRASEEFYVLPQYIIDGDTLYNIELRIERSAGTRKPSTVVVESYRTTDSKRYAGYSGKVTRKYKESFRKLFE
jgi:hypothetical protein